MQKKEICVRLNNEKLAATFLPAVPGMKPETYTYAHARMFEKFDATL